MMMTTSYMVIRNGHWITTCLELYIYDDGHSRHNIPLSVGLSFTGDTARSNHILQLVSSASGIAFIGFICAVDYLWLAIMEGLGP